MPTEKLIPIIVEARLRDIVTITESQPAHMEQLCVRSNSVKTMMKK